MSDELWWGQAQNGVNFDFWSQIWPWRSRSISPQNYRDLNQGLLHLQSKFGDPSLNASPVIARTSKWLTDRQTDNQTDRQSDRQTDRQTQTQATTIPEGQNWPRVTGKCFACLPLQECVVTFNWTGTSVIICWLIFIGFPTFVVYLYNNLRQSGIFIWLWSDEIICFVVALLVLGERNY